ncbi:2-succinyl-5-enolpyruvyl-6-hydroxy-3-cyclohexene-1-carboxylic-acid synthase [Thalassiella azotivora]
MSDGPNPSTAAARALVTGLVAAGLRHVVLCPGSRSAPLAYALHDAERAGAVELHVRHDERSAAFLALGLGSVGGPPAAVVTTSGTAVANLHPAVLEAHHREVPLLVLTADRPHRLRGTWANQTTDLQAGLFGRAVRLARDVPAATDARDAAAWSTVAVQAVATALGRPAGSAGPVHLDLAFDDPLVPAVPATGATATGDTAAGGTADLQDAVAAALRRSRPTAAPLALPDGPRTVVVAGDGAGWPARWLAEAGGWPLLAEPSSSARSGPNAVGPYRLLLEHPAFGGEVERVVAFGRPTLSRPVTRLLDRPDVEVVLVAPDGRPGPPRPVTRVAVPPYPEHVLGAAKGFHRRTPDGWSARWLEAGVRGRHAVDAVLDAEAADGRLTGPLVAREAAAALAAPTRAGDTGERLVVAASNAVRDLDLAAHPFAADWFAVGESATLDGPHLRVVANRGLAGIDGTVATAVGVARASGTPTRLLVGDLALLHDLGGLAVPAVERDRLRLQVVVVNDDGGGIFGLLEHGEPSRAASFERVFGTPHGADLAALCRGLGVPHRRAGDLDDLRRGLAVVPDGLSVLEVVADRRGLRDLHARLRTAVHAVADDVTR